VLLLAARYGLRPSDIRQLCLDQIDWRHRRLTLRQAKTGHPLALPLLADVADALVAYLRAGRPATREPFTSVIETVYVVSVGIIASLKRGKH